MSKLVDLLKRSANPEGPRIGFGVAARKKESLPLILIMKLPSIDKTLAESVIVDGADALLVEVSSLSADLAAVRDLACVNSDVPIGLVLREPQADDITRITEAGADFVVLRAEETPSVFLRLEDTAKVLMVDSTEGELGLRAISRMPVDIALVSLETAIKGSLTIRQILGMQAILEIVRRPSLFIAPEGLLPDDLESIRDAGFLGVLLDLNTPDARESLSLYRQKLKNMPVKRRMARESVSPLLPAVRRGSRKIEAEAEDEEVEIM